MATPDLVKALQAIPSNPLRVVRVKVTQVSPLKVLLPDGATVGAIGVTGLTYTVGGGGIALITEPSIPVVLPVS